MTRFSMVVVILVAAAGGACGGEAGSGRMKAPLEETARFVGTWQAVSGTVTLSCPGYLPQTDTVERRFRWTAGTDSDLVQIQDGNRCTLKAAVDGDTAFGSAPACDPAGANSTYAIAAYAFVLAPDGQVAQETFSGTTDGVVDGKVITCEIDVDATYRRVP
jgi:hypothetical protein